jgi:monovalent cation/hydrogen antiporter
VIALGRHPPAQSRPLKAGSEAPGSYTNAQSFAMWDKRTAARAAVNLVSRFELILLLMAVVIGLELLARRARLPPAAAFILGGIVLAFVPDLPDIELDPDLALVLFLPPLLLSSAYFTVWRDFRANLRIILQLAIGAVVFTTLAVGLVAHWVAPSLPWAACFALGAIVSPPDAVAAKAVLQDLPLPRRIIVLLEGESLVNDASGLVLYRFAVAAALTGTFDAKVAAVTFTVLALGGVAVGIAIGWLVTALLKQLRDPTLGILTSFLAAWAAYIVGEAVHVSGVLSTVACGLVIGWRQHMVLTAATRVQALAVWKVAVFILESLIFILIGLSLRGVVGRLGGSWEAIGFLMPSCLAIIVTVIVTRFMWMFPATYVPRFLVPALRRRDPYPPISVPIIMSWAGMRGVVSLAAALALPDGFSGRDFIVATTFAVILVTVLLQGATLAPLIRALSFEGFQSIEPRSLSEADARARMAAAQLAEVERHSKMDSDVDRHPRLVEQYGYRAKAAERYSVSEGRLIVRKQEHFTVVLAAIAAGRVEVLRLHRDGAIHDTVLHALEHELDLEEMTARRRLDEP